MNSKVGIFSGRVITTDDMAVIQWAHKTYPNLSRYELAGTVCELIGWVTPAGNAKTPQCMDFFSKMEAEGKLNLPALKTRKSATPKEKSIIPSLPPEITECGDIELHIVNRGDELRKWRSYVDSFHYLGDKQEFGSRLYYFIRSGGVDLGCMRFSAASWSLEERDKWIGWSADERKTNLFLVVNNSRFMLLPNVHIKNLASRALSLAVKQLPSDWAREFCYYPVLIETFVDTTRFEGTSYKASNWIFLGYTKGRGRMDRHHDSHLSRKAIYVYPLRSDFIDILKGVKPHETALPI